METRALMLEKEINQGMRFGAYLVEMGVISTNELEAALILQEDRNPKIGRLAQQRHLLTFPKLCQILEYQRSHKLPFGQAAIELGFLSQSELDQLMGEQSQKHIFLGELLAELKFMTKAELEYYLAQYFRTLDRWRNEPAQAQNGQLNRTR
jgi:hypothetical protein